MNKITIIGAGKTGRGFLARLACEQNATIQFIDKDASLVRALKDVGSFKVTFFGNQREAVTISGFTADTWDTADFSDAELILVSVGGTNLKDVGSQLRKHLDPDKHYYIITAENSSNPSGVLREAIGLDNISVSEATVFCTTIETDVLHIASENYPYLQCNADLLEGYIPAISSIKPIPQFGNFLTRKLFTYNAASCVIAYLGFLKGFTDYGEAANNPEILALLDQNYAVTNRVLCKEFGYEEADQKEFALLSRNKFCDRTIIDTVARNAREPQRKLGHNERVIGPLLLQHQYSEEASVLEQTVAAMLLYDHESEIEWRKIKAENTPEEILECICGLDKSSTAFRNIMNYYYRFKQDLFS